LTGSSDQSWRCDSESFMENRRRCYGDDVQRP